MVEFSDAEESQVPLRRQDLPLRNVYACFHFCLVARTGRTGRQNRGAVVFGHPNHRWRVSYAFVGWWYAHPKAQWRISTTSSIKVLGTKRGRIGDGTLAQLAFSEDGGFWGCWPVSFISGSSDCRLGGKGWSQLSDSSCDRRDFDQKHAQFYRLLKLTLLLLARARAYSLGVRFGVRSSLSACGHQIDGRRLSQSGVPSATETPGAGK